MTRTLTFRALDTLRSIADGVIATDAVGRVVFINRVAELLTGWDDAEIHDRPFTEVFPLIDQKSRAPIDDPVSKVVENGSITSLPENVVLLCRDGSELAIEDSCAPVVAGLEWVAVIFRSSIRDEAASVIAS